MRTLPGATPTRLELLGRLGLRTVGDLLFHFPRSYEDLTDLPPISALAADAAQTAQGEVVEIEGRNLASGGTLVSVVLCDNGVHCLEGVWFNQPYAASRFPLRPAPVVQRQAEWRSGHWQMSNPPVPALDGGGAATPGVVPVYPLTDGLRPRPPPSAHRQGTRPLRRPCIKNLPESLRGLHDWPGTAEALRAVHFPPSLEEATRARRRFIYEEFLLLQLGLALRRREVRRPGPGAGVADKPRPRHAPSAGCSRSR